MPNQQVTALWWLERCSPMTASGLAAAERITPQSMAVILTAFFHSCGPVVHGGGCTHTEQLRAECKEIRI
jgi:hypothetical protein